jgi:TonB family protein
MRPLMCVLVILTSTLATYAATSPSVSIQDVRFAVAIPNRTVTPPRIIRHTLPGYTREAHQRNIEGTVVAEAEFDIDGCFKVLRIVKGLGYGLDDAAMTALLDWRFAPAMRDGEAVSVIAEIEIPFRLSDDDERQNQRRQKLLDRYLALKALVFKATHPPAGADTPRTPH